MAQGAGDWLRHEPRLTKLASALLALGDITYDEAKTMTAEQVISYYDFDHGIRKAEGGSDMFYNLTPRLREEHREKTRKIDIPEIAKNKRRASKHEAHRLRMAEKEAGLKRAARFEMESSLRNRS